MARSSSLPRICIALGFSDPEKLLEHACQEVAAGESFFEFRLDYLNDPEQGVEAIRRLLAKHPDCTILATCRRHQNQGRFNGSIEEQIRILDDAVDAGARAVDVEIETAENVAAKLDQFHGRAQLVLSYHNFDGTPALDNVFKRMTRVGADAYKIATTAKKPSDNYRLLNLARTNPRAPFVMLAMGEIGLATRILGPSHGGLFTYAAPNAAEGTAPGQLNAKSMRQLYRVDKFSRLAKIYGVIADPVRHSISPAVHNRAFQARRLDAVYLPFLVHPQQLKDFFTLADNLPLAGFSVTIPHKQKILRYLDIVDPLSRRIGAVNTVWKKAGKWRGTNTDAEAVTGALSHHVRIAKSSILIAGNGGAARSAAFALADSGAKVFLVGRNADRVRALAKVCGAEPLQRDQLASRHFDVFLHSTPLGMFPKTEESFFEDRIPADVVFDMVYNPLDTLLIRKAIDQGKAVIRGLEMFLEQAVRQFSIWTGEPAPRVAMQKAAFETLGQRASEAVE